MSANIDMIVGVGVSIGTVAQLVVVSAKIVGIGVTTGVVAGMAGAVGLG